MTAPALEIAGLTVAYGDLAAVDRVDLTVAAGTVTALVGPSGCGKTSLLRAVAGFEEPAAGTIHIGGEAAVAPGVWLPPERRRIGMVFQEGALFPHLDVARNVAFGLARGNGTAERVAATLALVRLQGLERRYPDELSGGEQQRLALARALAPGPRLVLLDEPFASLDPVVRGQVREELCEILAAAHATALLVTHDQQEALSVADRVAVMRAGRIVQVGTPEEVYHRPADPWVATFVGEGFLVPARVASGRCATPFGAGETLDPDGEGRALVRPEDLALLPAVPDHSGAGQHGVVVGRRFFGHDLLDRVRLDDGEQIEVRRFSSQRLTLGDRVRVVLRPVTLRVFPAAAG